MQTSKISNWSSQAEKYLAEKSKSIGFWIEESNTSESVYFYIYYGITEMKFRISDHGSKKQIKSLIVQKNTKVATLYRFIENRVNDLLIFNTKRLINCFK